MSLFCGLSSSMVIDCKFDESLSFGYYCDVQNPVLIDSKISKVRGEHLSEKTSDDVKYFYSHTKKFNSFPRGVTKFFENIESVAIYQANLKEITKDDLKQFGGNLKNLWLTENEIEVIESDLFEFSPNLEELDFRGNKIRHIESGAFAGLKKIRGNFLGSGNFCKELGSIQESEENCKNPNHV